MQNRILELYYQYKSYWPVVIGAALVLVIAITGVSLLTAGRNKAAKTSQVQEVKTPQVEEKIIPSSNIETPKTEASPTPSPTPKVTTQPKKLPKTGFPTLETLLAFTTLGILGFKLSKSTK